MNRIISDTFEQLEELGKTTAKQVVQQPKKALDGAVSAMTGGGEDHGIEDVGRNGRNPGRNPKGFGDQKSGQPKLTQSQIVEKIERASQVRSKLHLQEIEEQIAQIQKERLEQIKKVQQEVFKEEKEDEHIPEVQLPSKRKKGLIPTSVKRLKQKVESFRGATG